MACVRQEGRPETAALEHISYEFQVTDFPMGQAYTYFATRHILCDLAFLWVRRSFNLYFRLFRLLHLVAKLGDNS
jgi:hypothetical protein